MVFNIGDRVRFKDDATDQYWSVVNVYPSISKVQVWSSCGNVSLVVDHVLLVPFDPFGEMKQAIREALLGNEFLAAFAAAWQKTPLVHNSELNLIACEYTGESFAEVAMKNYKSPEIITTTTENGEPK